MDVISVIAVTCAILVGIAILALIISLLNSVMSKNNSDKEYLPLDDGTNEMEMGTNDKYIIKNGHFKNSSPDEDLDLDFKIPPKEESTEMLEVENENINFTSNDQSEAISDESKSNKTIGEEDDYDVDEKIPVQDFRAG